MKLTKLKLERFKKISETSIDLARINLLVGGNNSGKSSVLEGIHFSVVAAVAVREADTVTFTQSSLLFCPTKEFVALRHGAPYLNQSNFGYLRVFAEDEDEEFSCTVRIYRGRNEGNVGCEVTGSVTLRNLIGSTTKPFSVYVPGLSGIPQVEECRTESIVRRGVASGDANLYLRNVILLIMRQEKLQELISAAQEVFPDLYISVDFNDKVDLYIDVQVSLTGPHGRKTPLELIGTGVQQALQIFSYVVLFQPSLLLLDEPDSHLHPDNQGLLAKAILALASGTNTNIVATTHSRHLVDALYDESNIIWLKDGAVYQQGDNIGRLPLLMDIGALDSFEKIREGTITWVVLTEDASLELIDTLLRSSGFQDGEFLVYSYKTSTNIQSALALSEFISEIAPGSRIIIHRDRDFMTDQEVEWITDQIVDASGIPFITEESDVDAYFTRVEHLATLLDEDPEAIQQWQEEIATQYHNEIVHKFTRKRDEAKYLYRKKETEPPDTLALLGDDAPLPRGSRLGKFILGRLRANMHERFGKTVDVRQVSEHIASDRLREILVQDGV